MSQMTNQTISQTIHQTMAPYGLWKSDTSIEALFAQVSSPSYPFEYQKKLYWLEPQPDQGGRIAVVTERGGDKHCLLPEPFNIRSRVHEYGGKCFVGVDNGVIFNNFADGCLYLQRLDGDCQPIKLTEHSEQQSIVGYADLVYLRKNRVLIAVAEREVPGAQNENFLVSLPIDLNNPTPMVPTTIVSGADFYCAPVICVDETTIAWIEWDNPYMQWDQSRLRYGALETNHGQVQVNRIETVVDGQDHSVSHPGFLPDNRLVFCSDNEESDFWNFYVFEDGAVRRLTNRDAEVGDAHWVFGQTRWLPIDSQTLVAVETTQNGDCLIKVDTHCGNASKLAANCAVFQHLFLGERGIFGVASYEDRQSEIVCLDRDKMEITVSKDWVDLSESPTSSKSTSRPMPVSYPTRDGELAHSYFYPPTNASYCGPVDDCPPLIVMVHGGPTSRTTTEYAPLKQYFASLGYAILDVNHRGSTGYGRRYRQKLLGQWGEIDAMDIVDGVSHVIRQGWVDPDRIFIRGGSAGGYAVLRALTRYGEVFAGGACYYGIGNLITLSEITHKFEGKYTDRLIGEPYDPDFAGNSKSRYTQRSPIFEMDRLVSPLILFQGLKDKVVPPAVSQEVVKILEQKALMHEYVEYESEGHGFRAAATKVDALTKETDFFSKIING